MNKLSQDILDLIESSQVIFTGSCGSVNNDGTVNVRRSNGTSVVAIAANITGSGECRVFKAEGQHYAFSITKTQVLNELTVINRRSKKKALSNKESYSIFWEFSHSASFSDPSKVVSFITDPEIAVPTSSYNDIYLGGSSSNSIIRSKGKRSFSASTQYNATGSSDGFYIRAQITGSGFTNPQIKFEFTGSYSGGDFGWVAAIAGSGDFPEFINSLEPPEGYTRINSEETNELIFTIPSENGQPITLLTIMCSTGYVTNLQDLVSLNGSFAGTLELL
ncbi:hypothetical protein VF04_03905 [Nostoc linckia z7]|uniref:Uncharacterized protein n=2 Tax=Nostoc linckia TaxID=92942 RepID=A0A9Q5ZGB8_NOSLI|nr:hypothetical protein [Nostoc linckia]PHK43000.1 hypothetical protein VF12_01370 [Nostoc linckia z15]PHK48157.1 hypothetical protein VF13_02345 [Nostoc linckia z16]PHJ64941.1 hypothetical protein VF02_11395 [Nostoc linckia z1]PHJ70118.1 hypothetical protein VF05_11550 [Nostoc linckia z3]PHJ75019.1 hypothetical protein VF03_11710 [Nostoc linckia z2]